MAPLELSEPIMNVDDWTFEHKVDTTLQFHKNFSFAGLSPGSEYRHVKLASDAEQGQFLEQITAKKEFSEMFVSQPCASPESMSSDNSLVQSSL